MAFSKVSGAEYNLLKIESWPFKSYLVDQRNVLGQGAFGVVFKGFDDKRNTIAAKRIYGNKHPRILTQDLDRFRHLNHPNVMKILDVEKNENVVNGLNLTMEVLMNVECLDFDFISDFSDKVFI